MGLEEDVSFDEEVVLLEESSLCEVLFEPEVLIAFQV
jgi:hypothetical protein